MEVSDQLNTPVTVPLGVIPWYLLYRRLGEVQSWSECYGEEKNLLPLPGSKPRFLICPACSIVTVPTELPQLLLICYKLGKQVCYHINVCSSSITTFSCLYSI
jgi:hypothetical protein